jgi:hypothetical protein
VLVSLLNEQQQYMRRDCYPYHPPHLTFIYSSFPVACNRAPHAAFHVRCPWNVAFAVPWVLLDADN